jgi:aminoglycoside phosphotransferase
LCCAVAATSYRIPVTLARHQGHQRRLQMLHEVTPHSCGPFLRHLADDIVRAGHRTIWQP